jgi:glycosyltransferase involved in cell wall biosynthesis
MKIAVISTTIMAVPLPGYGGLEQIAWQVATGLGALGHQVLLVAPNGSTGGAGVELHGTTLHESEKQAYSGYWQRLSEFDVIIDHSWEKWAYRLKMEGKLKAPVLGVCHAPIATMHKVAPPIPKPCLIGISTDHATSIRDHLHVDARVAYNGIDLNFYRPNRMILSGSLSMERSNSYLFLARMSTVKSPDIAISVARAAGVGLDLVGDDKITGEPAYVQHVKDMCGNGIRYVGPQTRSECVDWFCKNRALLHTAKNFREPFGLAPVEAQACGMPVLTFDNGAMRETVKHGVTGFVVKDEAEMIDLIKNNAVKSIKATDCIAWASQWSVGNMVLGYEKLCIDAINNGGW